MSQGYLKYNLVDAGSGNGDAFWSHSVAFDLGFLMLRLGRYEHYVPAWYHFFPLTLCFPK